MGGDDDHATVAVVTGHTVQRGLRSLDRIFLGIQHTVRNLVRGDFLDERLTDAGAGDRNGIVVGVGAATRQWRIANTPGIWLVMPPVEVPAAILPDASRRRRRWCHASPFVAIGLRLTQGIPDGPG